MSTPDLHADAAAISNASPAIKKFAQDVADILQPVTPPPVFSVWPQPCMTATVWNQPQPLSSPTVDANSAATVSNLVANKATAVIAVASYSVPVYVASGKAYTVTGKDNGVKVTVAIPSGAKPAPGTDGHLCVIDYTAKHEVGMYHAAHDASSDTWTCDYLQVIPFDGVNTNGVPGANDANLPFTAGLLVPEHFTGAVLLKSPLAFVCKRGVGPIRWPSCKPGANNGQGVNAPTNGMWMRLPASYDVSQLPIPWERQVAVWLKAYGMVCRDGSPNLTLFGEDTATSGRKAPAWPWGSGTVTFSAAFPWDKLQVLAVPVPYQ